MDALTVLGLFAVTAMLVFYVLEYRSHWFVLAFAAACALGSFYGFMQGAWPFGIVEAIWPPSLSGGGAASGGLREAERIGHPSIQARPAGIVAFL